MQTEDITLNVSAEIAHAFRRATPEAQQQASQKAEEVLRYALMSGEEAAREFEQLADSMSRYAADQGLTPEKLKALLNDDDA